MTRIDIPGAKRATVLPAGALPAIDPARPEFVLALGGLEIRGKLNPKAARKLAAHQGSAVLQGKLVVEGGKPTLLEAGFQFLEPKPPAESPDAPPADAPAGGPPTGS